MSPMNISSVCLAPLRSSVCHVTDEHKQRKIHLSAPTNLNKPMNERRFPVMLGGSKLSALYISRIIMKRGNNSCTKLESIYVSCVFFSVASYLFCNSLISLTSSSDDQIIYINAGIICFLLLHQTKVSPSVSTYNYA
jgi:hypothetical protein